MNRLLVFFTLLLSSSSLAQYLSIDVHGKNWFPVNSYQGGRISELIRIMVHLDNTKGMHMENWSLYARVVGPISNGAQTFSQEDVSKLKFQISKASTTGPNKDGQYANLNNIGANLALIPFRSATTPLIVNSPYNLSLPNKQLTLIMDYDVSLDGGAYLEKYKSWSTYNVTLEFELRNRKGELMPYGSRPAAYHFGMQLYPNDTPIPSNEYSISLSPEATNVLFEFKTPSDYANGIQIDKPKGISIVGETPYFIEAYTLSNDLQSSSSSLPISSIQLSLEESSAGVRGAPINLSTSTQTLFTSKAHQEPRFYNMHYYIKPPQTTGGFFNKPYELYSGTILFSITPQ